MENKKIEISEVQKFINWLKKHKIVVLVIIGVVVTLIYFLMRNNCVKNIDFYYAGSKITYQYGSFEFVKQDQYRYNGKQFKTRKEAINFCMSKKLSSED